MKVDNVGGGGLLADTDESVEVMDVVPHDPESREPCNTMTTNPTVTATKRQPEGPGLESVSILFCLLCYYQCNSHIQVVISRHFI